MKIWNEVAPRYHKRWATAKRGPFQSTKKLIELIDIKKGNHVLDVASGTGVVTKLLKQKVGKAGYVIGADTSVTAIKVAKKWNKKSIISGWKKKEKIVQIIKNEIEKKLE